MPAKIMYIGDSIGDGIYIASRTPALKPVLQTGGHLYYRADVTNEDGVSELLATIQEQQNTIAALRAKLSCVEVDHD